MLLARPTCSQLLYLQMLGRGLRLSPHSGKVDCLAIDLVGTKDSLQLVNIATLFGLDPGQAIQGEQASFGTQASASRELIILSNMQLAPRMNCIKLVERERKRNAASSSRRITTRTTRKGSHRTSPPPMSSTGTTTALSSSSRKRATPRLPKPGKAGTHGSHAARTSGRFSCSGRA